MQDPTAGFQLVEKIVQLCKEESGAVYLIAITLVVIVNFLPIRDWASKIFPRQDSELQDSNRPLKQYVFPHSENPTIIENLNLMIPPKDGGGEEKDDE